MNESTKTLLDADSLSWGESAALNAIRANMIEAYGQDENIIYDADVARQTVLNECAANEQYEFTEASVKYLTDALLAEDFS